MNPFKASMAQAVAGMQLQSQRIGVSAENLSNVDTPGYQRKMLIPPTGETSADAFRSVAQIVLDQSPGEFQLDPAHPLADQNGYVTMSNVSLITEMADLREANRTYEANLNSFQQARTMYQSLLDVLRR